ncbi:MAG: 4-oxalocrotonate tautomerase family protein [Rhodoglobus sp.]|nr:4-oxalocrotonate tautomerase family protein [Rhodoglobus sp.]
MPYVNVRILDDGVSAQQKSQVIAAITDVLVRVLGKTPQSCHVVIDEIPTENWGFGGESVADRRNRETSGS